MTKSSLLVYVFYKYESVSMEAIIIKSSWTASMFFWIKLSVWNSIRFNISDYFVITSWFTARAKVFLWMVIIESVHTIKKFSFMLFNSMLFNLMLFRFIFYSFRFRFANFFSLWFFFVIWFKLCNSHCRLLNNFIFL